MNFESLSHALGTKLRVLEPNNHTEKIDCFNSCRKSKPLAIVRAETYEDIKSTIAFARDKDIKIGIHSGGHSTYALHIDNNTLVIDLSLLSGVDLELKKYEATVKGAASNADVDAATSPYQLAIPLGTCPSVSVIGATLGGGIGFLSRQLGLMCDTVKSFKLTTANGDIINADLEENADLFWALKGAGASNFGVVLEAKYHLNSVPLNVYGGMISWPISAASEILEKYFRFLATSSNKSFLYLFVPQSEKSGRQICVFGFSIDEAFQAKQLFLEISQWSDNATTNLGLKPYREFQSMHYQEHLTVEWQHCIIDNLPDAETLDKFSEALENCPDNEGGMMIDPLGGAINQVASSASAFPHRSALAIISINGFSTSSTISAQAQSWVDSVMRTISAFNNDYAYVNYESLKTPNKSYYGENLSRLNDIKAKYDPNRLFNGKL